MFADRVIRERDPTNLEVGSIMIIIIISFIIDIIVNSIIIIISSKDAGHGEELPPTEPAAPASTQDCLPRAMQ